MNEQPQVSVNKSSADYKQGFADGQSAKNKKWPFIAQMWGGLGLFLLATGFFVGLPAYEYYTEHDLMQAKIEACEHTSDVVACIKEMEKD
jgi:hypothetical protein